METERIIGIRRCGSAPVYNFSVLNDESYTANGVVVHNCRSDLLPVTITRTVDPQNRIENRDFSQPMDQNFNLLDDRIDEDLIEKTFFDIDTFRKKYSIDQFILDEDLEARLQKLNIQVLTELPGTKTKDEIVKEFEDEIRARTLKDGEKGYLINDTGEVLLSKVGVKNGIQFTEEELKLFKGQTLTHSHPFKGSFSDADIALACHNELNEIRAAGTYRTYIMKMENGKNFYPGLWIDDIRPIYKEINAEVRADFEQAIFEGKMVPTQAEVLHWHEVWNRVSKKVQKLDYSFVEVGEKPW